MKYFNPTQSKLLSELGMVSESGMMYSIPVPSRGRSELERNTLKKIRIEMYLKSTNWGEFFDEIPAFFIPDFISPSEVARENCKKLWGDTTTWRRFQHEDSWGEYRDGISNDIKLLDMIDNHNWESFEARDGWLYHQHRFLNLSEDEVIEEIMKQANTLNQ